MSTSPLFCSTSNASGKVEPLSSPPFVGGLHFLRAAAVAGIRHELVDLLRMVGGQTERDVAPDGPAEDVDPCESQCVDEPCRVQREPVNGELFISRGRLAHPAVVEEHHSEMSRQPAEKIRVP